ncbi:hypothetical protein JCM3766R1_003418 [Sporobolomyces carnicolor]
MRVPFLSTSSTAKDSSVLALSSVILDHTKRSLPPTSTNELQARLSRLAGNWAQLGTIDARASEFGGDWVIQRCHSGRMARIDRDGRCFCGTLADTESTHCEGFDENDRRTVCIEDLRESAQTIDDSDDASTRKRKEATCGLEFLDGFEPDSCPVGFVRIGEDPGAKDQFICQDAASPYSCGPKQIDCSAQEGVLRTQCKDSVCEPLMCQEGWRFRLIEVDDGTGYGTTLTGHCVKSRPLFFNSDASRYVD